MVSDKLTLSLLSRLADVQLALATGMRGITPETKGYPGQTLQKISHALDDLEVALVEIGQFYSSNDSNMHTKLH